MENRAYTIEELMMYENATQIMGISIRIPEDGIVYYFRRREDGLYVEWFNFESRRCFTGYKR